jgi:heme-degrading monooxygenase HmoA
VSVLETSVGAETVAVRSFITFHVKEDMIEKFKQVYTEGEFLERAEIIPGFLEGEFLCLDEASGTFAATALWDSDASYRDWQDAYTTAIPREYSRALMACLTKFEAGQTYRVVNRHGGTDSAKGSML